MEQEDIFGYVATCFSVVFYITLSIPFIKVLRCEMTYDNTPIAMIITIYVDCLSWYFYSERIMNEPLGLCNKIGICICISLAIIYLAFEIRHYIIDTVLNGLIMIMGTLVVHKSLIDVIDEPQTVGKFCFVAKVISFHIPIITIYKVIRAKNYLNIPIFTSFAYLVSNIGWAVVGKKMNNIYISIGNLIGVVIILVQIGIYFNYRKFFKKQARTTSIFSDADEDSTQENKTKKKNIKDGEIKIKGKTKRIKIISRIND